MIGEIDASLLKEGFMIVGVDEAGRGPLFGPVTVAAVSLLSNIEGLNDSKKLSAKKRNQLLPLIIKNSYWSVYSVSSKIIDKKNILQATLWGMRKVVASVAEKSDRKVKVLIDGNRYLDSFENEEAIIKGDSISVNIAAASIIAKVYRDRIMTRWSLVYPNYNFDKNKGYPTKSHYDAIEKYGITSQHRKSFKLIKNRQPKQLDLFYHV